MYIVYDRMYKYFPAENTVYTPYLRLYVWFWPNLHVCACVCVCMYVCACVRVCMYVCCVCVSLRACERVSSGFTPNGRSERNDGGWGVDQIRVRKRKCTFK